jgi:hypothetical protein
MWGPRLFAGQSDRGPFRNFSDIPNRNFVFAYLAALPQYPNDISVVAGFSRTHGSLVFSRRAVCPFHVGSESPGLLVFPIRPDTKWFPLEKI